MHRLSLSQPLHPALSTPHANSHCLTLPSGPGGAHAQAGSPQRRMDTDRRWKGLGPSWAESWEHPFSPESGNSHWPYTLPFLWGALRQEEGSTLCGPGQGLLSGAKGDSFYFGVKLILRSVRLFCSLGEDLDCQKHSQAPAALMRSGWGLCQERQRPFSFPGDSSLLLKHFLLFNAPGAPPLATFPHLVSLSPALAPSSV